MLRDCPTFPLLEEIRKAVFKKKEDREKAMFMTFSDKESLAVNAEKAANRIRTTCADRTLGVEPWDSVKHLQIRVPESVRALIQRTGSPSPLEERRRALKRERQETGEGDDEFAAKKIREDEPEETASQTSVDEDLTQVPDVFL
uniref:Uncharacterized protein n=1 Tax=Caenorhabditis japonica TaxID=281687 RepID=A0A8R1IIR5_CAEJA